MLSQDYAKERLRQIYHQATPFELSEGISWYVKAHMWAKDLALKNKLPTYKVAAVVAALSPSVKWDNNLASAKRLIETPSWVFNRAGTLEGYQGYKANVVKAVAALQQGTASMENLFRFHTGPKVWSFYRNILQPEISGPVTLDRHAFKAVLHAYDYERYRKSGSWVPRHYETVAGCFREVASQCKLRPHELQAVVWVVQRKLKQ